MTGMEGLLASVQALTAQVNGLQAELRRALQQPRQQPPPPHTPPEEEKNNEEQKDESDDDDDPPRGALLSSTRRRDNQPFRRSFPRRGRTFYGFGGT